MILIFLSYKNVVDFAIRPDFDYNIPKEATEFLKNLSQAKFKGNNLAKHMLLKDKFHECLHLESLVVKYNFTHSEGNGSAVVEYVFTDYRTDNLENSEFQFNTRVTFDSAFRGSGNKRKVERGIFEVLESHKMHYYNKFKTQH